MSMKKSNNSKKILFIVLIILILLAGIVMLIKTNKSNQINNIKQDTNELATTIGDVTLDITNQVTEKPNAPKISAGMIPIKYKDGIWQITTADDEEWRNSYNNGKMSCMMLNDGVYQSEMQVNMTNKKLAESGTPLEESEMGTVFTWVPRFAYNKENNSKVYLKDNSLVAVEYTTPEIFTYSASGVNKQDIALLGVWVEKDSGLLNKVSAEALNLENNTYGFIANTKAENSILDSNFIESINSSDITGITNIANNKMILKVIDEKVTEPIMAKLSAKGKKAKVEIIKSENGIRQVITENGDIFEKNEDNTFTHTVEKGGLNRFIIIDNKGNQRLYEITIISPEIVVITNVDNYVEFNGEKWYPYGTEVRINYVKDMTGLAGYYKNINGTLNTPMTWRNNGTSEYADFTLNETMKIQAKIENSIGEILGEDEEIIHIMPRETSIPYNYYNYTIGEIYPVQVSDGAVGTIYGTETYAYNSPIRSAAMHMGLIKTGEEKVMYIKIVPSPQGGYIGSVKNGISSGSTVSNINGYIFVTEEGEEIKLPKINEVKITEGENKITVNVNATTNNGDKTISKYYYSIDSKDLADYVESDSSEYTFESVESYKNHTIRVYVKDNWEVESNITETTTKTSDAVPVPTIRILKPGSDEEFKENDEETIEYNGEIWYPYGTRIEITYSEDMTNLYAYYKTINEITGAEIEWYNLGRRATYIPTLYEPTTYIVKTVDYTGAESEEVRIKINIMPNSLGTMGDVYCTNIGAIYPVKVTGYGYGTVYGTDIYTYNSRIDYSAIHMGLLKINETKDLFIKIVDSPAGGYKGKERNGITSQPQATTDTSVVGYIFVTKDGTEVKSPVIESSVVTSGENSITATITASTNIGTIEKYYYSIDDDDFLESTSNTYTFAELKEYNNHTIKVYVEDSNGFISDVTTLKGRPTNNLPTPTIEIIENDTNGKPMTYKGETWYPSGTRIQVTYLESGSNDEMKNLNLVGQVKSIIDTTETESGWWDAISSSNGVTTYYAVYTIGLSESVTYKFKLVDSTGAESEEVSIHLNIMANDGSFPINYYENIGGIYPVRVTGRDDSRNEIYGTDTYKVVYDYSRYSYYYSYIYKTAVHMGLVDINETKDLFVKIVEEPEGGYKGTTKNGITSLSLDGITSPDYNGEYHGTGYIFVTEDGKEIKSPTLNSITASGGENSILVSIDLNYTNATQNKFYYSIDDGDYIESTSSTYTFEEVEAHKNHTIKIYAKDSNGAISEVFETTAKPSNEIPKPTIEIVDKDTLETANYDGKTWYPGDTKLKVTCPDDMTNLTLQVKYIDLLNPNTYSGWGSPSFNDENANIYTFTYGASYKYIVRIIDEAGEAGEESEIELYAMPNLSGIQYGNSLYVGKVFPVVVTGNTSGSIYGSNIYYYNSYIGKAAMHMGLLEEGQKETLYIKVVKNEENYYQGSVSNGVESLDYVTNGYGFVFTSSSGSEIKKEFPVIPDTNEFEKFPQTSTSPSGTVGDVRTISVTGTTSGSVWGTNVYTTDSNVSKAATHMGLVKVGETKSVYVKTINGQSSYTGSTKNGVTTSNWNSYPKSFIFLDDNLKAIGVSSSIDNVTTNTSDFIGGKYKIEMSTSNNSTFEDANGEKWYPYGTKLNIKYTSDANAYYLFSYSNTITNSYSNWSYAAQNSKSYQYTTVELKEPTMYYAKITDSRNANNSNNIIASKSMKINIMPQNTGLDSSYDNSNAIGKIVPVQVTYTTSGTCYGTNTYRYNSNINVAATHMGLVTSSQRNKTVYIKIVECPTNKYVSSTRNGVTTSNYNYSANGFIFLDENGNEIIQENTIGVVGATLSGYNVLNNGLYNFKNDGSSIIPTNTGVNNSLTANSYIELDLTGSRTDELYSVTLNAEVSSRERYDYGYATITESKNASAYNYSSGRFVNISGTVDAKNYSIVIAGGKKYYLHLGYYKYSNTTAGLDMVKFNSLSVTKLSSLPSLTLEVDKTFESVDFKGEKWYPYGTKLIMSGADGYIKYYEYEYSNGNKSGAMTTNNADTTLYFYETTNITAGYTNDCNQANIKLNIMPYAQGVMNNTYYSDNRIGTIYPVQVIGTNSGKIYGTAKYTCDTVISTAATHMGLVKLGETKTLYIKIIPFPESGYKASRMNNIVSTASTEVKNGYVFVDENGNEILTPVAESNATLSGYNVYPNGSYYFEQLGDSIICSSPYNNTTAESYIEIDLSNKTSDDMFSIIVNMEVLGYYYGSAQITTSTDTITTNDSSGYKFTFVQKATEDQNYETIVPGGKKYYLHLGSYKYNNTNSTENGVKFNSLTVTQIPADKKPVIEIDPSVTPIIYKGEEWYPYYTNLFVRYGEDNYINSYIDNKNYRLHKYKYEISNSGSTYYTINGNSKWTLTEPTTFWAKYSEKSPEETLKVNVMPNQYGSTTITYSNTLGSVYPVQVTGTTGNVYGNNIYLSYFVNGRYSYYTSIAAAATHMGLVDEGETKTVYIKIVGSPEGGYVGVKKNNITSTAKTDNVDKGFVFVTEDGQHEILEPIIESTSTSGGEDKITVTVNAVGQNNAKITKYYYQLDNNELIESDKNVYTFEGASLYATHTVKAYVRDEYGAVSQTAEIITNTVNSNLAPVITFDKDPIDCNGELWYPAGTKMTISFVDDMTNLTGYYSYQTQYGDQTGWNTNTSPTYTTTLNYSTKYWAKVKNNTTGKETEVAEKSIKVMPSEINGPVYYYENMFLGNIYPVQITGTNAGATYGSDVYIYSSNINLAATHMGLVNIDETKVVYIKMVPAPIGGYIGSTRYGVTTQNHGYTYNGFIFVDESGNEIVRPRINSLVTTSGDNEITVTVDATSKNRTIEKYYYSIDNGEYIENSKEFYTFKNITTSGEHTIKVYAKDSNGDISVIKEINGHRNTPAPTLLFNKEPVIYNGEKWYPYETTMTINFSTMDTGYLRRVNPFTNIMTSWIAITSYPYQEVLYDSKIYEAYSYSNISGESEHIREKINIMPDGDSALRSDYWNYGSGNVYPVRVTGRTDGNVWGTNTYKYNSNISKAATHAGLVEVGEAKVVYIKIVPCPEGGYIGSEQNGIKSNDYALADVGFTFVQ